MTEPSATDSVDNLILIAIIAGGTLVGLQWVSAATASFIATRQKLSATYPDAMTALLRLPEQRSAPAEAWPDAAAAQLPGPWLYWPVTALVHILAAVIIWKMWSWISTRSDAIDRRQRLGVEAQSHIARRRDLKPLAVRGPEPGRYLLGRSRRRLLATEPPAGTKRGRTTPGAVAVIAPSRSGKTVSTIKAARQWQGPAVLSSVKRDLIDGTMEQRAEIGEVRIYDPTLTTGYPTNSWTPLHSATTRRGATRSARMLLSATGHDRTGNGRFWSDQAETLLSSLLWLAANTDHTVADVAQWVSAFDHPKDNEPGVVAGLLRALANSDHPQADEAHQVQRQLNGIWSMDSRMASSYYVSARLSVSPWTDPVVAESAKSNEIDLDWLTSGNNTLYIVAPVIDQHAIAPALGGLIGDLVTQAMDRVDRQQRTIDPGLLLVLDEAANTPIAQLPSWVSLLSGYYVQLVTIWQSKSQIDALYGTDADAVLTNHRTKIFYGGMTDLSGLQYVATLLGHEHQPGVLSHTPNGPGQHASPAMVQLTPPNVIRGIKTGEALAVHGNLPPIHLRAL